MLHLPEHDPLRTTLDSIALASTQLTARYLKNSRKDFVNYLAADIVPPDLDYHRKKKFFHDVRNFYWDEPLLFKRGKDGIFRRCIPEEEVSNIIKHCHSAPYGGHASTSKTYAKILQVGLFWPTMWRDVYACIVKCDRCQRTGNISRRDEMPLRNI
ncbi:hypothetical protein KIW84_012173 [Lathyrus oleraceus]|uniref:Integrase zinc-binding domain-containing protein n=1 Tax=Pisum sativum TaxID=3888 RepID=A0A9D5BGU5_PEA|nr:hypothetical protein KIW84_012173 [Pisum sativum]